jgi:anthranilate phosphoribosyltransferase
MSMKQYIEKCLEAQNLTADEASAALELIMTNQATEAQIAGLLVALRAKGETVDELVGFARTMRQKSVRITVEDENALDIVGTGGDGLGTFNISTAASIVAAGAGVTIAKHGNRSVSSRSGSADLLRSLGVNIDLPPEGVERCINTTGIGFLFAPLFHPAMKYAAKPRVELGVKTIFNMVGPLTNPAGASRQVVGAYNSVVASHLASALALLEATRACVVHGSDGIDEVALSGETSVFEVTGNGGKQEYSLRPSDFGLPTHPLSSILGGSSEENAAITNSVLSGEPGPPRDVVVANAALGLYVSGKARSLPEGRALAEESIDSGRALQTLKTLIEVTNRG